MSYSELLKEKGLTIEQLSKTILTKIETLEAAKNKIADFESEEDLDEKEQKQIVKLKKKVEELENEVYKAILKFDPENYKKRLELLEKAKNKRTGRPKKQVSAPAPAPVVAMTEPETEQHLEELSEEVEVIPEELEEELCEDCLDDLRNGRLSVEEIRAKQEEDEEFEKVSNAKPRKLSQSVIIMGIGAFILTWGAVNFFRERRG